MEYKLLPDPIAAKVWLLGAALAGGITSVVTQKGLTFMDRLVSGIVGFMAAIFIAPAILAWLLPQISSDSPYVAAFYYLVALLSMSAIPPMIRAVKDGVFLRFALRAFGMHVVEDEKKEE